MQLPCIANPPSLNISGIMSPPSEKEDAQGCKKAITAENYALLIFPNGVKSAPAKQTKSHGIPDPHCPH
jgi:hypothetical protein